MIKHLCAQLRRVFYPSPSKNGIKAIKMVMPGPGPLPPRTPRLRRGRAPGPPPAGMEASTPGRGRGPGGRARAPGRGPRHRQKGVNAFVPTLPSGRAPPTGRGPAGTAIFLPAAPGPLLFSLFSLLSSSHLY